MMTIIDLVRLYQLFSMKVVYQGVISPRIIELGWKSVVQK